MSFKIIRDPIYGYISVPNEYCRDFIDTPFFQRLRRIEQTSMRVVYPSAHHDRFAHSLGVFHLGCLAFAQIVKNSKEYFSFSGNDWESFKVSFEIACLMHDCGHSPFSHTFEFYYLYGEDKKRIVRERIENHFRNDGHFQSDYKACSPAPHEIISALVTLENFTPKILKHGGKPDLVARMIMGCTYKSDNDIYHKFLNRLIKLLNGTSIDVDTLDYIQRDTWASGVSNVSIDYHRLLSSLSIQKDNNDIPIAIFNKNALSVLSSIIQGRNFLYKWIYSHHKVIYEQHLLKESVKQLINIIGNKFADQVFSIDAFTAPQDVNGINYFLPTDDDIYSTLKKYYTEIPEGREIFSREYHYKALWKTHFEFDTIFTDVTDENKLLIKSCINQEGLQADFGNVLLLEANPKMKNIVKNDFYIKMGNNKVDASKAVNTSSEELQYFILYVPGELMEKKTEIISSCLHFQQ